MASNIRLVSTTLKRLNFIFSLLYYVATWIKHFLLHEHVLYCISIMHSNSILSHWRIHWGTQRWCISWTTVWWEPNLPQKTFSTSSIMDQSERERRACQTLTGGTFLTSPTSSYTCSTSMERLVTCLYFCVSLLFFLNFAHSHNKAFGLFGRLCLNSTDKSVCLPVLLPGDCARLFDTGHNHLAQLFHTADWKVARTCLLSPPSLVSIVHSVIK